MLLRNDAAGAALSFTEVSQAAGVDNGYWGWGTTFLDCDSDALLDIASTNGFDGNARAADSARLFRNEGGSPVVFSETSAVAGFNDTFWGSTLIAFDSDRDGDLDVGDRRIQVHSKRKPK